MRLTQVFANLLNNAAKYTDRRAAESRSARGRSASASSCASATTASASRRAHLQVSFRHVHAGRSLEPPRPGRARHRADAGAQPGRDARRQIDGAQRTARAPAASSWCAAARSARCRRLARSQTPPPAALPARRVLVVDDNRDAADTLATLLARARRDRRGRAQRPRARSMPRDVRAGRRAARHRHARHGRLRGVRAASARSMRTTLLLVALTGWGQDED